MPQRVNQGRFLIIEELKFVVVQRDEQLSPARCLLPSSFPMPRRE